MAEPIQVVQSVVESVWGERFRSGSLQDGEKAKGGTTGEVGRTRPRLYNAAEDWWEDGMDETETST